MFDKFERLKDIDERKRTFCNSCARVTIHTLEAKCQGDWEDGDPHYHVSGGSMFSMLRCGACDGVSFETISWDSESVDYDEDGNQYALQQIRQYPHPQSDSFSISRDHVPIQLDQILDEALNALGSASYLLATVGLRMTIEFIVKDQKISGKNLMAKIGKLKEDGLIEQDQHDLLQIIREHGNKSAHEIVGRDKKEIVAGFGVAELLIEKYYNAPGREKSKIAAAKRILQKSKTDHIL